MSGYDLLIQYVVVHIILCWVMVLLMQYVVVHRFLCRVMIFFNAICFSFFQIMFLLSYGPFNAICNFSQIVVSRYGPCSQNCVLSYGPFNAICSCSHNFVLSYGPFDAICCCSQDVVPKYGPLNTICCFFTEFCVGSWPF